ncbi:hypothetical protein LT330_008575 [Penicillium expansum]|nr:hypothetical protein LT330_008575 [Penicillium expansum]
MASILEWLKRLFGSLKFPVTFPTAGWEIIPADEKVEEQQMPDFLQQNVYLPVTIGDILLSRYQVVGKLGWGTTSTVWLVHDLEPLESATQLGGIQLGDFGSAEPGDAPRNGQLLQPALIEHPR